MRIGMLGTGNQAIALGRAWAIAGHEIVVTGRDADHATAGAAEIGQAATAAHPRELAGLADVVVVAVPWSGLESALVLAGGSDGALAGRTVIDCTNPVDFTTGRLLVPSGSAAEVVADAAPGAHVVKALHLFAGTSWPFGGDHSVAPVVALCGDHGEALDRSAALVSDLGGRPVVVGGLDAARQAEEAAGFVMRIVAAGQNPRFAVPDVDPERFA